MKVNPVPHKSAGGRLRHLCGIVCLISLVTAIAPMVNAQCDGDAKFVLRGKIYRYGAFGEGATVNTFGPVEGAYSTTYDFPGGTTKKNIRSTIDASSGAGILTVDLMNKENLTAKIVDGNDWGGGYDLWVDVYVKGPAGTPYFLKQELSGSVKAIHGGGAGTTQAGALGTIAAVTNDAGQQILPVSRSSESSGVTSAQQHPSCPDYTFAASVGLTLYGFTFQSINFCIPCNDVYYEALSDLTGTIDAGCVGSCAGDERPNGPPGAHDSPPTATQGQCSVDGNSQTACLMDPVSFFSGELYLEEEDMRVKGRGMDFVWARKYRSRYGRDTEQGFGWDYSYNIGLEADGADFILQNGWNRAERLELQPGGTWQAPAFFYELEQNPDTSHTLTHPDTSTWNFLPFDGSPSEGKIDSIVDRNGNTISFGYDGSGRLASMLDTLGRLFTVAYDANGQIQSVTDFDGRQVLYQYYDGVELGGSAGDLKSVRSPIVTGAPNGNDFPSGKVKTYTYAAGMGAPELDHNLISVTDPRGNTYVFNEYATTTTPTDLEFDRIVRQTWGDPGDLLDVTYVPQSPGGSNNGAVIKAILNDRVGHVKELFYDEFNRLVLRRDFTGSANADVPTTESANRPSGSLRVGDPVYFETQWEHNTDSLVTRITHPNGNQEEFVYDESNVVRRSQGNRLEHRRLPGALGGDQPLIAERFVYATDQGGCCGTNFVTRHIDARGRTTVHDYDAAGNRIRTTHRISSIVEDWEYNAFGQVTAHVLPDNGSGHRRRDEFTYYAAGPQSGYLQSEIVDAGGLGLTTTYEYDNRGNVVRRIDPRGKDTLFDVNQLDQVVRERSRAVSTLSGPVRYERDTYFDANDNVVQVDAQNVDGDGLPQANSHITTTYEFEILNRLTRKIEEVDSGHAVTTEYSYDANRNRVLLRHGEATNGNDPFNSSAFVFDERDLLFQRTTGAGSPEQSTEQFDYDFNGNLVTLQVGIEGTPHITETFYDGFDRVVEVLDAMGNSTSYHYDYNSNVTSVRVDGELVDSSGFAGNVRLSEETRRYDNMERLYRIERAFFDPATQAPIGDGLSTRDLDYSGTSQVVQITDDNGQITSISFDTANREVSRVDALGNSVISAYDANSNLTAQLTIDRADSGASSQSFTTSYEYDALDRRIAETDNLGNRRELVYDSRDNPVRSIDALGNVVESDFDGLNRLIATAQTLTNDGTGGGAPIGQITTTQSWDDSSRLTTQTDDNGHPTSYAYDSLNRRVAIVNPDGTIQQVTFDEHHNAISAVDANGTTVQATFDLNDRITNLQVTPGAGVSPQTTFETYSYDGLGRLIAAVDDDSSVTRVYDSLSNMVQETLDGRVTDRTFDGEGNQLSCTYPGGRRISTTFDPLNRPSEIRDQPSTSLIASYQYVGRNRVESKELGNGTRTDVTYDGITGVPNAPGDFGVRRVARLLSTRIGDGLVIDDRSFTWDSMQNKTQRSDDRPGGLGRQHDHAYDSVYRLVGTTVRDGGGGLVQQSGYELDGVHNRLQVTGDIDPGAYSLVSGGVRSDAEVNQYSTLPIDGRQSRGYDANGNLIRIGYPDRAVLRANFGGPSPAAPDGRVAIRTMVYDYRNRLVSHRDFDGTLATYSYDALGRRIGRHVARPGAPETVRYYYDRSRVIEERDASDLTTATYVYGNYIDEVLQMQRDTSGDNALDDHYYHTDDLYSVMAVTSGSGAVLERYDYEDYGKPAYFTANGAPLESTKIGNPYGFTGRRFDTETGWYYYRMRYLDPEAGRFISREPFGAWYDSMGQGNGLMYVGSRPGVFVDPSGQFLLPIAVGVAAGVVVGVAIWGWIDGWFVEVEQPATQAPKEQPVTPGPVGNRNRPSLKNCGATNQHGTNNNFDFSPAFRAAGGSIEGSGIDPCLLPDPEPKDEQTRPAQAPAPNNLDDGWF